MLGKYLVSFYVNPGVELLAQLLVLPFSVSLSIFPVCCCCYCLLCTVCVCWGRVNENNAAVIKLISQAGREREKNNDRNGHLQGLQLMYE